MTKSQILQDKLQELITKDMDRTSFIKHVGLAAFAMTGASAMAMILMHSSKKPEVREGYSASNYGGKHKKASTPDRKA
jgi:hypothetical protein